MGEPQDGIGREGKDEDGRIFKIKERKCVGK